MKTETEKITIEKSAKLGKDRNVIMKNMDKVNVVAISRSIQNAARMAVRSIVDSGVINRISVGLPDVRVKDLKGSKMAPYYRIPSEAQRKKWKADDGVGFNEPFVDGTYTMESLGRFDYRAAAKEVKRLGGPLTETEEKKFKIPSEE